MVEGEGGWGVCQQDCGVLKGQGASISQIGLKKRAFKTEVAGEQKGRTSRFGELGKESLER